MQLKREAPALMISFRFPFYEAPMSRAATKNRQLNAPLSLEEISGSY
jgi:hypothetical protein